MEAAKPVASKLVQVTIVDGGAFPTHPADQPQNSHPHTGFSFHPAQELRAESRQSQANKGGQPARQSLATWAGEELPEDVSFVPKPSRMESLAVVVECAFHC